MSNVSDKITMPIFAAYRRFDPQCGDSWASFIEWSGLHHVREIISTDPMLCPSLIDTLIDDDWNFNIHADNRVYFFHDFEYLKRRIKYDPARHNILALTERPIRVPVAIDGFEFCGYDILDSYDSISVLVNCGGFPTIFKTDDINQFGLVDDLDHADKIATSLRETKREDPHCGDCRVWGIARYNNATGQAHAPELAVICTPPELNAEIEND